MITETKRWTKNQLNDHLTLNSKDTYSMAVCLAALYKKLYSEYPKIGLSGAQAEMADSIVDLLPEVKSQEGGK